MRIHWNNLTPVNPISSVAPRTRVAGDQQEISPGHIDATDAEAARAQSPVNLTPEALKAALLEIGIAADPEALALAETFARLGLPLTDANMVEGRAVLARFPKLPVAAYALARILDAPMSAGVLRALARVIEGALAQRPLTDEALNNLSLLLNGSGDPNELAKDLYNIIGNLGRSTENQLLEASQQNSDPAAIAGKDPRALLLSLAISDHDRATQVAADSHAGHVEGQQMLNQIALNRFDPPVPLYFSFPFKISEGQTVPAEVQVWTRDDDQHEGAEYDDKRLILQTTIRLNPSRLGQIEVRLSGRQDAQLACQVFVERPMTYRLLRRTSSDLASGLSNAGWNVGNVDVGMAEEFEPLWFGGAALTHPRGRVDQKA